MSSPPQTLDCVLSCKTHVRALRECLDSIPSANATTAASEKATKSTTSQGEKQNFKEDVGVVVKGNLCMEELVKWKDCCEKVKGGLKGDDN
mmetsp:Transcript_22651/g.47050  ORF Transcript_22651/g.47050 Transcript_22651/m.47050 type:complete len:91 (+) Transcript_22651:332-604(+)|eukprot:CAMPEP_0118640834 /NCGR_PEP_ID=MMETSP0785-20121206/4960_1 /TAXON_ID=91992 /ORGANISM="Bolidomonas pacifica, Strain CCMP 1866" /LENGTH=90 /DNA_ID=CAMNT_0006532239 /DNA_START=321 /DNA_END=593 /DNA_ORIENTATION=+